MPDFPNKYAPLHRLSATVSSSTVGDGRGPRAVWSQESGIRVVWRGYLPPRLLPNQSREDQWKVSKLNRSGEKATAVVIIGNCTTKAS